MDFETDRGEPLHELHQELVAVNRSASTLPTDLLVSALRLSGGYQHLKGGVFVEAMKSDDGQVHHRVYWAGGGVVGAVTSSMPADLAASGTFSAGAAAITARVFKASTLHEVALAGNPLIRQGTFGALVSINAAWRLRFTDGSELRVPEFGAPDDSMQRDALDRFVDAALADLRVS